MHSDSLLMQQIGSGDESALSEFFSRYGNAMLAYAQRLVNEQALAEEIVQESLVAIWKGARTFRAESKLQTWVLGIVYHKSISALRARKDLPLEEDTLQAPEHSMPGPSVEKSDRTRILTRLMNELPADQKSILELVFFHRMSLEETAEAMKCPLGTVKSRLFNARKTLGKIITRHGYALEDLL